ncbi:hypothetical protein Syun_031985 [Stephania yunnanensis]|uniref:Uncharacterized protein n=1 Tax=Stephania yunnanensis TaxID=152371 RepID=A0AAP0E110_9MAGN
MMGERGNETFGMDREKLPPAPPTTSFPSRSSGDSVPSFSQNKFARPRRIRPPSFLLPGTPYEFNDSGPREETSERNPTLQVLYGQESLLAILYRPPTAVLPFWLGGAELGSTL